MVLLRLAGNGDISGKLVGVDIVSCELILKGEGCGNGVNTDEALAVANISDVELGKNVSITRYEDAVILVVVIEGLAVELDARAVENGLVDLPVKRCDLTDNNVVAIRSCGSSCGCNVVACVNLYVTCRSYSDVACVNKCLNVSGNYERNSSVLACVGERNYIIPSNRGYVNSLLADGPLLNGVSGISDYQLIIVVSAGAVKSNLERCGVSTCIGCLVTAENNGKNVQKLGMAESEVVVNDTVLLCAVIDKIGCGSPVDSLNGNGNILLLNGPLVSEEALFKHVVGISRLEVCDSHIIAESRNVNVLVLNVISSNECGKTGHLNSVDISVIYELAVVGPSVSDVNHLGLNAPSEGVSIFNADNVVGISIFSSRCCGNDLGKVLACISLYVILKNELNDALVCLDAVKGYNVILVIEDGGVRQYVLGIGEAGCIEGCRPVEVGSVNNVLNVPYKLYLFGNVVAVNRGEDSLYGMLACLAANKCAVGDNIGHTVDANEGNCLVCAVVLEDVAVEIEACIDIYVGNVKSCGSDINGDIACVCGLGLACSVYVVGVYAAVSYVNNSNLVCGNVDKNAVLCPRVSVKAGVRAEANADGSALAVVNLINACAYGNILGCDVNGDVACVCGLGLACSVYVVCIYAAVSYVNNGELVGSNVDNNAVLCPLVSVVIGIITEVNAYGSGLAVVNLVNVVADDNVAGEGGKSNVTLGHNVNYLVFLVNPSNDAGNVYEVVNLCACGKEA